MVTSAILVLGGIQVGAAPSMLALWTVLTPVQLTAAGGTIALYRWCFGRPATNGASLLAALSVSVMMLSDPTVLEILVPLATADPEAASAGRILYTMVSEGAFFVGIVTLVVTLSVLLFELPFRWLQGHTQLLDDGAHRAGRCLAVIALVTGCSALLRQESMARIAEILQRVLWPNG